MDAMEKRHAFFKDLNKLISGSHMLVPVELNPELRHALVVAVLGPFNAQNTQGQPCYSDDMAAKANRFVQHILPNIWAVLKNANPPEPYPIQQQANQEEAL